MKTHYILILFSLVTLISCVSENVEFPFQSVESSKISKIQFKYKKSFDEFVISSKKHLQHEKKKYFLSKLSLKSWIELLQKTKFVAIKDKSIPGGVTPRNINIRFKDSEISLMGYKRSHEKKSLIFLNKKGLRQKMEFKVYKVDTEIFDELLPSKDKLRTNDIFEGKAVTLVRYTKGKLTKHFNKQQTKKFEKILKGISIGSFVYSGLVTRGVLSKYGFARNNPQLFPGWFEVVILKKTFRILISAQSLNENKVRIWREGRNEIVEGTLSSTNELNEVIKSLK